MDMLEIKPLVRILRELAEERPDAPMITCGDATITRADLDARSNRLARAYGELGVGSGGANVYPAEVEAALESHPQIRSAVVVGLPDDDLGQRVHAVIQATAPLTDDDVRSHVAERLVRYKVPRSFEFVDTPLRDDAGKVRRGAIRDAAAARMTAQRKPAGARS